MIGEEKKKNAATRQSITQEKVPGADE